MLQIIFSVNRKTQRLTANYVLSEKLRKWEATLKQNCSAKLETFRQLYTENTENQKRMKVNPCFDLIRLNDQKELNMQQNFNPITCGRLMWCCHRKKVNKTEDQQNNLRRK